MTGSPDQLALQTAAAWFATLQASDASATDHARWERWLAAAPAHRAAWQKIEAVNRQFGSLPPGPALAALNTPPPRRSAVKKIAMLTAAVTVGALASRRDNRDEVAALLAGERTAVGSMRQLTLADGSGVWMNTDSALDVDFTPDLRRIALHRGEIVVHSSATITSAVKERSPLVVDVRGARLTALGTRFGVYRAAAGVRLSVYEGAVRVVLGTQATRLASAGQMLHFDAASFGAAAPADPAQAAWTRNRLSVERMRLDDFLATLARYRHGHLGCNPAIAGLQLTGSYPLGDTARILAALEKTLPVRVNQVLPWWVTLEPA